MFRKLINKFFRKEDRNVNNSFVRIIQLAEENESFRNDLKNLLEMPKSGRIYIWEKVSERMKRNNEPDDIVEAFLSLKDEKLAKMVMEYISNGK